MNTPLAMRINFPFKYLAIFFWAAVLAVQFILFNVLSHSEKATEAAFRFFQYKQDFHQKLYSAFAFSSGDVLYILLAGFSVVLFYKIFFLRRSRKSLLRMIVLLNAIFLIYQLFWGMLYFGRPIADKLPETTAPADTAEALAEKYLKLCIRDRETLAEDHNGVFKISDIEALKHSIISGQKGISPAIFSTERHRVISIKPSLFSGIMSYTGILGYYNPFTAEAQYNPNMPQIALPFTLAHEHAHQLGAAREQEASFVAYLLGKDSDNPELKYSTEYFVLKSVLSYLADDRPAFVRNIISRYSPAMQRDRFYEKLFAVRHRGAADDFFAFTNNLFLKSNRQEGSITYNYFTDLLLRYEQQKIASE